MTTSRSKKARIKDEKARVAAVALFGDLAKAFEGNPRSAELELKLEGAVAHPLTARLELEPVPDNAPWHAYHGEALKVRTPYLVVYEDFCGVNYGVVPADSQGHLHKDVIAWLDIPKWRK